MEFTRKGMCHFYKLSMATESISPLRETV